MIGNWEVYLWDDEELTADGGKVVYVHIRHLLTGVLIAGFAIRYDDGSFIDTIVRDDLTLPSAITRRLLMKVYDRHIRGVPSECPSGLVSFVVLGDFIDDVYDLYESDTLKTLISSQFLELIAAAPAITRSPHLAYTMKQFHEMQAAATPVSYWWQIEIQHHPDTSTEEPIFIIALCRHRRIDRQALQDAHRQNPAADLADLLKSLSDTAKMVAVVGFTDSSDPAVRRLEQNDFGFADGDAASVAMEACRQLARTFQPFEVEASAVIQPDSWLGEYVSPATAARVRAVLTPFYETGGVAAKEIP